MFGYLAQGRYINFNNHVKGWKQQKSSKDLQSFSNGSLRFLQIFLDCLLLCLGEHTPQLCQGRQHLRTSEKCWTVNLTTYNSQQWNRYTDMLPASSKTSQKSEEWHFKNDPTVNILDRNWTQTHGRINTILHISIDTETHNATFASHLNPPHLTGHLITHLLHIGNQPQYICALHPALTHLPDCFEKLCLNLPPFFRFACLCLAPSVVSAFLSALCGSSCSPKLAY